MAAVGVNGARGSYDSLTPSVQEVSRPRLRVIAQTFPTKMTDNVLEPALLKTAFKTWKPETELEWKLSDASVKRGPKS
jgi:hypothetical protein